MQKEESPWDGYMFIFNIRIYVFTFEGSIATFYQLSIKYWNHGRHDLKSLLYSPLFWTVYYLSRQNIKNLKLCPQYFYLTCIIIYYSIHAGITVWNLSPSYDTLATFRGIHFNSQNYHAGWGVENYWSKLSLSDHSRKSQWASQY